MYADNITDSMRAAIDETMRRRKIQQAYNQEHNITPKTIIKPIAELISTTDDIAQKPAENVKDLIQRLEEQMLEAARRLEFEKAAKLRDRLKELYEEI